MIAKETLKNLIANERQKQKEINKDDCKRDSKLKENNINIIARKTQKQMEISKDDCKRHSKIKEKMLG